MTTWDIEPMRIARTKNDSPPLRNDQYEEEASQSYSKYDPVQRDASAPEEIEIFDNTAKASSGGAILGLALKAATGTAATQAIIEEIDSNCIMEANYMKDSSGAVAITDLGDWKGIKEDSSGNWVLYDATSSSSPKIARIIGLAGLAEIGDVNPRVEFEFAPDYLDKHRDLT